MMTQRKVYISAFFFLSLFFASGFISFLPIFSNNVVVEKFLKQSAENNTPGEAEETIEKEEVKIIYTQTTYDLNCIPAQKSEMPVTNEQCRHLFTPAILVPPPERLN